MPGTKPEPMMVSAWPAGFNPELGLGPTDAAWAAAGVDTIATAASPTRLAWRDVRLLG